MPNLRNIMLRTATATLSAFTLASSGCLAAIWGNGDVIEESRSLSATPSRIIIDDGLDLVVTVDPAAGVPALSVQTDRNLLKYVKTEINGDVLHIYSSVERNLHGSDGLRINVHLPYLLDLQTSGGSDADVYVGTTEHLRVHASGGSDLTLHGIFQHLEIEASGGSDVNIQGSAAFAAIQVRGGSDLNARNLSAVDVDLHASGGSDASVCVTGTLSGSVSGGSDLTYWCKPIVVDVERSGGSDVNQRG